MGSLNELGIFFIMGMLVISSIGCMDNDNDGREKPVSPVVLAFYDIDPNTALPVWINISGIGAKMLALSNGSYAITFNHDNQIFIAFSKNLYLWSQDTETFVVNGSLQSCIQLMNGTLIINFYFEGNYSIIYSIYGTTWSAPVRIMGSMDCRPSPMIQDSRGRLVMACSAGVFISSNMVSWEKVSKIDIKHPSLIQRRSGDYLIVGHTWFPTASGYSRYAVSEDLRTWADIEGSINNQNRGRLFQDENGLLFYTYTYNRICNNTRSCNGSSPSNFITYSKDGINWTLPIRIYDSYGRDRLWVQNLIQLEDGRLLLLASYESYKAPLYLIPLDFHKIIPSMELTIYTEEML